MWLGDESGIKIALTNCPSNPLKEMVIKAFVNGVKDIETNDTTNVNRQSFPAQFLHPTQTRLPRLMDKLPGIRLWPCLAYFLEAIEDPLT
jgi:hypothetical protein